MKSFESSELPFCGSCPVQRLCSSSPKARKANTVQHVAAYIDRLVADTTDNRDELLQTENRRSTSTTAPTRLEDLLRHVPGYFLETAAEETATRIDQHLETVAGSEVDETTTALRGCAAAIRENSCQYTQALSTLQ